MHSIGVIIASNRPGRNADAIAAWLQAELDAFEGQLAFSMIDLAEWSLPHFNEPNMPAQRVYQHQLTRDWSTEIARHDGFIFLTPEYNHGYPGLLKDAIDFLYHEWCFKPVAFVGYGTDGAFRAMEQLRSVASGVNMVAIRRQIGIPVWEAVTDGNFTMAERYHGEAQELLRQLEWFTATLAEARAKRPVVF